jgi:adenosylcobyric acid synthase
LLTAALCRVYARRGVRVAPFKAQNMSNNAMVCEDGAEIGRSQALQAFAARATCHSDMNPVLLKPEGHGRSQVIVNGKRWETLAARDYYQRRKSLWPVVTAALDRLRENYDLVIMEGAGSPAELNLAEFEIVNMAVARYAQSPVVLVGDIERGGIFAQLLGTLWLLDTADRQRIAGLVVNKFRGDLRLFDRGVELIEERGGAPVLGVLPWLDSLSLPEEDTLALADPAVSDPSCATPALDIAIIRLPHLSNFDDFDPLKREPSVRVRFVGTLAQLGRPAVVILPGTKNTLDDLQWLRQSGIAARICQLAEQGTVIVGICGGYQMLGQSLINPDRVESEIADAEGLGLLPIDTVFVPQKQTHQVLAEVVDDKFCPGMLRMHLTGYEIHSGQTQSPRGWLKLFRNSSDQRGTIDGARSPNGRIWGCYMHGLFDHDGFRHAWLKTLGVCSPVATRSAGMAAEIVDADLDRLADAVESHLNMEHLDTIVRKGEAPVRNWTVAMSGPRSPANIR